MRDIQKIIQKVKNKLQKNAMPIMAGVAVASGEAKAADMVHTDAENVYVAQAKEADVSAEEFFSNMKEFMQKQLDEKKIFLTEGFEREEAYLLIQNGKESLEICYYPAEEEFSFNDGKDGSFYLDKKGVSWFKYDEQGGETREYLAPKKAREKASAWNKTVRQYEKNGQTLDVSQMISQQNSR